MTSHETYGDVVAPAHRAREGLGKVASCDPVTPMALDDGGLEQRTEEEDDDEDESLDEVGEVEGPPAQDLKGVRVGEVSDLECDVGGEQSGHDAGKGHGADAGFDDGWSVAGQLRGGSGLAGEVEGHDVDEGAEDLRGGLHQRRHAAI